MRPTEAHLAALRAGVELEDGFARAEAAEVRALTRRLEGRAKDAPKSEDSNRRRYR